MAHPAVQISIYRCHISRLSYLSRLSGLETIEIYFPGYPENGEAENTLADVKAGLARFGMEIDAFEKASEVIVPRDQ